MPKLLTFFTLIIFFCQFSSAQNLIANGTFEDVNICSESQQKCSPEAWRTVNPFMIQYLTDKKSKKKVNRFIGFSIYNTNSHNVRNYIQSELICPMIQGKSYKLSFELKPELIILESIGILFSDTLIFVEKEKLLPMQSTVDISSIYSKTPKRKKKKWVKIDIDYTATGKEKYIIIGNFQKDNDQQKTYSSDLKYYQTYYYYIDNVSLYTTDSSCWCQNSKERKLKLYDQNDRHSYRKEIIIENSDENNEILESIKTNEKIDTIKISDLSFGFNSSKIDSNVVEILKSYIDKTNINDIESIDIFGHTDSIGTKEYNLDLSLKRAIAVKTLLTSLGLANYFDEIEGVGDIKPIASNETEIGRQMNRRVEIIIHFKN